MKDLDLSKYKVAVACAFVEQIAALALASATLDLGEAIRIAAIAIVAFWVATYFVIRRNREAPSSLALAFVRIGYLPLFLLTAGMASLVWGLMA